MQIQIVNGIYADTSPDFRTSYPKNYYPVPKQTGINQGYLKPAEGIEKLSDTSLYGLDRGGINWLGVHYRVLGSKLIRVDENGNLFEIGDVGDNKKQVTMTYSFDRLAIASDERLFYWDNTTFQEVTDPNLLEVLDLIWVDGYFMTTDGEFLVVTELSDPTVIDPLKYGSSEASPDPIKSLLKLRNEVYALNRYTIEVFDNIGGTGFPFQRIEGAQIDRGVIGTHACCVFLETIAFLGSGREESPAIWLGNNSTAVPISTREIEQVFLEYTEEELESTVLEARIDKHHKFLYVHLPDKTLVYDGQASIEMQTPIWFTLSSSLSDFSQYQAKNIIWVYDKWISGDPTSQQLGYFIENKSTHYDNVVEWEFATPIIYNSSKGALFHELELVALTGSYALGENPTIATNYSLDGLTFSQKKYINIGTIGNRSQRLVWRRQGKMRNWRVQRFRGTSNAHLAIARLEANVEGLNG